MAPHPTPSRPERPGPLTPPGAPPLTGPAGRAARSGSRRRFLGILAGALAAPGLAGCLPDLSALRPGGAPAASPGATQKSPPEAPPLPGRLLYVGDSDIWLWEQGAARRLTGDRVSRQPAWSPDGKRIAHIKIDVSSSELWLMDDASANSQQLTNNYSRERVKNNWAFRPVWWPDGTHLLYLGDETTYDLALWQVQADGRGRRLLLAVPDREGGIDGPSLSPDGKRLAAITYRAQGGKGQVWAYTFPGGPWQQLTDEADGAYDPAWSPDGSRLAYVARRGGRHDVWLMDADGSNPAPLTASGAARAPCWSPDGKWLAFISGEGGRFDVWALAVPDRAPPAAAAAPGTPPAEPPRPPPARPLTRGAALDPVSGLSWTTQPAGA